jgi:hypothetical protein
VAPTGVIHQRDYRKPLGRIHAKGLARSNAVGRGAWLGRPRLRLRAAGFSFSGERQCPAALRLSLSLQTGRP